MPKLIIEKPNQPPETFDLTEESASIGRLPENTIQIEVPQCSRRQAQILRVSTGFEITDLKSSNGTMINGVRKERHLLRDGDVIGIGDAKITFRDAESVAKEVDEGGCFIMFSGGILKGERVALSRDRTTFGRSDRNVVVIAEQMTSSYHCEITREGDGYVLRDLGSTNGTVVNGEPISETTLSHGARIRVGKSSLIFVDPAVADYEKALAAEEEAAEAEWGMMRAQVDMARVKKARRAAFIGVGVFVVILGGAAVLFTLKPDFTKGLLGIEDASAVKAIAGNEFEDFSFEREGRAELRWRVPEDQDAAAERISGEGVAHQGKTALSIAGAKEGWPPVYVRVGEPQRIGPGKPYEISGWLKPERGSRASLGVIWNLPGEAARPITLSPWAEGGDWQRVETVVSPPKGARSGQFIVLVAGDDSALVSVDDVCFKDAGSPPDRPGILSSKESGNFLVRVTDNGGISISFLNDEHYVLWNGGFVGLTEKGEPVLQEMCFRAEEAAAGPEDSQIVRGRLLTPGGESVPLSLTVTPRADRVVISIEIAAAPAGVVSWGLGFRIERDYLETLRDHSNEPDGKLFFGKQRETAQLLSLRSMEESTSKILRQASALIALVGPAGKGVRSYELETRVDALKREASNLLDEADGARGSRDYGRAIALYERVMRDYPFDDLGEEQARPRRDAIVADGRKRMAGLESSAEAAKDFSDEGDLARVRSEVEKFGEEFLGHEEFCSKAEDLKKTITTNLGQIRKNRQDEPAKRFRHRAEDFEAVRMYRLARVFAEKVRDEFSGTEHETWAKTFLEGLRLKDEDK